MSQGGKITVKKKTSQSLPPWASASGQVSVCLGPPQPVYGVWGIRQQPWWWRRCRRCRAAARKPGCAEGPAEAEPAGRGRGGRWPQVTLPVMSGHPVQGSTGPRDLPGEDPTNGTSRGGGGGGWGREGGKTPLHMTTGLTFQLVGNLQRGSL